MKNKASVPNAGFDKTIRLLHELGYRSHDQFARKAVGDGSYYGMTLPEEYFELLSGPRGCVLVQKWKDGGGANVYTDWTVGHTFNEMKVNLASEEVETAEDARNMATILEGQIIQLQEKFNKLKQQEANLAAAAAEKENAAL